MNLLSAYRSIGGHFRTSLFMQLIDGFWSQIRWAWASIFFVIMCWMSIRSDLIISGYLGILAAVYCYVLPIVAHRVMHADIKVRIIDWLCLPLAVLIKAIGPNLFLLERLLFKSVKYEKVER